MSEEGKRPWLDQGRRASEQYAKAKVQRDKQNALLKKTVAALGPKKRAAVEAKATAKTLAVTKAKVTPVSAKVIFFEF